MSSSIHPLHRRFLLFIIGCIGTRILLAYIAKNIPLQYLPIMGYAALIPAFGFSYIFLTGSRDRGFEVDNERIWWNSLRPIHALIYFAFSYNAIILKSPTAWMYLAFDVILGIAAFLVHHFVHPSSTIIPAIKKTI
jgi:hypothetical protein